MKKTLFTTIFILSALSYAEQSYSLYTNDYFSGNGISIFQGDDKNPIENHEIPDDSIENKGPFILQSSDNGQQQINLSFKYNSFKIKLNPETLDDDTTNSLIKKLSKAQTADNTTKLITNVELDNKLNKDGSGLSKEEKKTLLTNLGIDNNNSSAPNFDELKNKLSSIESNTKDSLSGVASAISMANLPTSSDNQLSASYGYYKGFSSFALGFSGGFKKLNYKISTSINTNKNWAFGLGLGYKLGGETNNIEQENSELKKKNEILSNKVKVLESELEKIKSILNIK